jgi:hypothetical protein
LTMGLLSLGQAAGYRVAEAPSPGLVFCTDFSWRSIS